MKISEEDRAYIDESITDIINTPQAQSMKTFIQHGHITTYAHVMNVVCMSCRVDERLHAHCDKRSLIRGAFLHDFYLYDWHDPTSNDGLHGFKHPERALAKAQALFELNPTERNIIISHMWPLTATKIPRCREAAIVCLSDKLCALYETILKDKALFEV